MSTFSAAFLLFLILDPLGYVPVFLTTLKSVAIDLLIDGIKLTFFTS